MNTKVSDLTIDELKELVSKTVQETLEDYLKDFKALSSKEYLASIQEAREDWIASSLSQLSKAYSADEPDYSLSMIKEPNTEYKT